MKNGKIVKCKYSKCLHDKREMNIADAIKKGNNYYHRDCLQTQNEIKEIIDLFKNKVNANPVYSQLQSVIHNIVFTRGIGSELLLFGLKFYIENKIPLNYPQGLYYVIQNKKMIDAFNKKKMKAIKQKIVIDENNSSDTSFVYHPTQKRDITDIIM